MHVSSPPLPQALPAGWTQQTAAVDAAVPPVDLRGWWKAFNDPVLNGLVDTALEQNLGLLQAKSRLQQSRLVAHQADVAYLPGVMAGAHSVDSPSGEKSYFQATLNAVWDLGLFGMREGAELRSQGEVQRATAELQAARVSVVAEIVRNYIELRAAQAQSEALSTLGSVDELARLTDVRIQAHVSSKTDKEAIGKRDKQNRLALSSQKLAEFRSAQALAVLLGRAEPDPAWGQAAGQPVAPSLRISQMPSDLLRTRPEIQRAEAEVLFAAGESGMARARLYPHVAIGTSYLFAYDLGERRKSHFDPVPLIGPAIDIPLFDWGARKAGADAGKQAVQAALQAYRQALIEAVTQTEVALATLNHQTELLAQTEEDVAASLRQARRQDALIRLGVSSPYEKARLMQDGLQVRLALIEARAARAMAIVTLYKAIGGAPYPDSQEPS